MTDLDYVIRDPRVLMILANVDEADFNFLLSTSGLGRFDLRSHLVRLKSAGYVETLRKLYGSIPDTGYRLTESGQEAAKDCLYWLKAIRSARCCRPGAAYSWTDNHQRLVRMEPPVRNRLREVAQR